MAVGAQPCVKKHTWYQCTKRSPKPRYSTSKRPFEFCFKCKLTNYSDLQTTPDFRVHSSSKGRRVQSFTRIQGNASKEMLPTTTVLLLLLLLHHDYIAEH